MQVKLLHPYHFANIGKMVGTYMSLPNYHFRDLTKMGKGAIQWLF